MASDARDEAVVRLEAALAEQDRLVENYDAAMAQFRDAADEVAARKAWLKAVDDDGLGGRLQVNGREVV